KARTLGYHTRIGWTVGEDGAQGAQIGNVEACVISVVAEYEEVTAYIGIRPGVCVEVTLDLEGGFTIVVLHAHGHVAATIGEVRAHDGGNSGLLAVPGFRSAVLGVDFHTLEVVAQDEVGHAADGIGTVYRGGATGND